MAATNKSQQKSVIQDEVVEDDYIEDEEEVVTSSKNNKQPVSKQSFTGALAAQASLNSKPSNIPNTQVK
jgi:hypothetical protein